MKTTRIDALLLDMQQLCLKMANAIAQERRLRLKRPKVQQDKREQRLLEITTKLSETFKELGHG